MSLIVALLRAFSVLPTSRFFAARDELAPTLAARGGSAVLCGFSEPLRLSDSVRRRPLLSGCGSDALWHPLIGRRCSFAVCCPG